MKIVKFILLFLLVTAAIFALVVGLNWTAFKAVFSDPESFSEGSEWVDKTYSLAGLVEYMEARPDNISVVSLNLDDPDGHLFFNEQEPRVMGSLSNLFLLMEYSRQVQAGLISLDDRVEVDAINRFLVPTWYNSAHRNALNKTEQNGGMISLEDVILITTKHFSQPASDWLFFHLGPENVNALVDSLGGGKIGLYTPGAGIQVSVITRNDTFSVEEHVAGLSEMDAREAAFYFQEKALEYSRNENLREETERRAGHLRDRLLADERRIHGLWAKTEPLAFAEILKQVYGGEFISPEASARIIETMTWAYEEPVVQQHASDYGALFESRLGFLNGMDFGTSRYTEHSFAQVVFFENLPIQLWLHMSSNFMNQDLQRRLIYDPAAREMTERAGQQKLTPAL